MADYPPAFVTYGWCRTAYVVVKSLAQKGIEVHVGDNSPFAMSRYSRYAKSFTKLDSFFSQPDSYFEQVLEALKKTGAKVLLPSHEDIGIFSRRRNEIPSYVMTALPDIKTYELIEDKFTCMECASEHGCPVPRTYRIDEMNELKSLEGSLGWPVVLKTRISNSAKGVRIAKSPEELKDQFEQLIKLYSLPRERWPIVQEYLPGEAVGLCLLFNRGKCVSTFAERYIRCKSPGKFGTSTLRETFENINVLGCGIRFLEAMEWNGLIHMDFIADSEGIFKLIEVNPRPWGALALAVSAGVDFPYLWYLLALGEEIPDVDSQSVKKIKCRWLLGDFIAFIEHVTHGKIKNAVEILKPCRQCFHDDFDIRDPLPFIFENIDYFSKFVKSGGSTNPVEKGIIR